MISALLQRAFQRAVGKFLKSIPQNGRNALFRQFALAFLKALPREDQKDVFREIIILGMAVDKEDLQ